jgi:ketosteroid isomerase-like protein
VILAAMRPDNVAIVRHVNEAWSRGDFSSVEVFDPRIEFETGIGGIDNEVCHGLAEMSRRWGEILRTYGSFRSEPEEVFAAGDKVVVFVISRFTPRGGGDVELTQRTGQVWTFCEGKAIRLALHGDREAALREAGLE